MHGALSTDSNLLVFNYYYADMNSVVIGLNTGQIIPIGGIKVHLTPNNMKELSHNKSMKKNP
jgi:hypothetical protein